MKLKAATIGKILKWVFWSPIAVLMATLISAIVVMSFTSVYLRWILFAFAWVIALICLSAAKEMAEVEEKRQRNIDAHVRLAQALHRRDSI